MWKRNCQLVAVEVICVIVHRLICERKKSIARSSKHSKIHKNKVLDELMYQLQSNIRCRDITHMEPEAFANLYGILQEYGGLQPTKFTSIEEQVAKFLYILSHNARN